jgi:sterol desaturase/sphingolipid hydroxylase (fatty acid hydroxylase superfamily)
MQLFSSIANAVKELTLFLDRNIEYATFAIFHYILIAGGFYLFFYTWLKKFFWRAKIQQQYAKNKHIIRDIKYSFLTIIIFFAVFLLVIWANEQGYTLIDKSADKHGFAWRFLNVQIMVIVHDAYFYWTHRLLHWKPIFNRVHKTHHLSRNPTPFSAYAFHPIEAIINAGIIPLIAFTIPCNISTFKSFIIVQLILNVYGHLGYELFPKWIINNWFTKFSNTSTHHNLHHQFVKSNYGLYYNFWDWIMKTNHPKYEAYFEEVTGRRGKSEVVLNEVIEQETEEIIIKNAL